VNAIEGRLLYLCRIFGVGFSAIGAAVCTLWPLGWFAAGWILPLLCLVGVVILLATETLLYGLRVALKRISGIFVYGLLLGLGLQGIGWGIVKASGGLAALALLALLPLPWLMRRFWGAHFNWKDLPVASAPSQASRRHAGGT
jgi:hypothetical protein